MNDMYKNRGTVLCALGFNNYTSYLESPLWDIIRRSVLHRDKCNCRAKGCPNGGVKQAHHISYSRAAMIGVNPSVLLTLCKEHHCQCEFDQAGNRLCERDVFDTAVHLATGDKRTIGRTSTAIGLFFKKNWIESQKTAIKILGKLKDKEPVWYHLVLEYIRLSLLSPTYVRYLGLEEMFPKLVRISREQPHNKNKKWRN